jgi:hypothetical protein
MATVLLAFALVSVATPVCAMPSCDSVGAHACATSSSKYASACEGGGCADGTSFVVMKHADELATSPRQTSVSDFTTIGSALVVSPLVNMAEVRGVFPAPDAPPPDDPLGVRLSV